VPGAGSLAGRYDVLVAQAVKQSELDAARRRAAADRMRGLFADVAPRRSLVDELIAERRADSVEAESAGGESLQAPASVLDASALLALVHDEQGAVPVADAIAAGAAVSVVNVAEVLSKLAEAGKDPELARSELRAAAGEEGALVIEALSEADCVEVARLRITTRELGLSLADRACLALAKRLAVPVLTADRTWAEADIGLEVRLIR
jgi:ribonuclease VapC